jgi:hypothetical protein
MRLQPLAVALAQAVALAEEDLLKILLRGKVSRRAKLTAGIGLQFVIMMPHFHRSQIRWSSVNLSCNAAARPFTCTFE